MAWLFRMVQPSSVSEPPEKMPPPSAVRRHLPAHRGSLGGVVLHGHAVEVQGALVVDGPALGRRPRRPEARPPCSVRFWSVSVAPAATSSRRKAGVPVGRAPLDRVAVADDGEVVVGRDDRQPRGAVGGVIHRGQREGRAGRQRDRVRARRPGWRR